MRRFLLASLLFCSTLSGHEHPNKLMTTGSATLLRPADLVTITFGVVTTDKDARTALTNNGAKMKQIIAQLPELSLTENEFKTGAFTLTPQYSHPPKNPPEDWQPSVVGYEVKNTITVRTKKLEVIEKLIDVTNRQGANLIQDLHFSLEKDQEGKAEAIANAVKEAEIYAQAAAKQAGVTLGKILDLTVNTPYVNNRMVRAESFKMALAANTPIVSGDIELTASVTVTYEILKPLIAP